MATNRKPACHPDRPHYAHGICKNCYLKPYFKKWYSKNKEHKNRHGRQWLANKRAENPNYSREVNLELKYGITVNEYFCIFYTQGGLCAICGNPETAKTDKGELKWLSVDHDHAKKKGELGFVRGLLCRDCNLGLGRFHDDIDKMQLAIKYLQNFS